MHFIKSCFYVIFHFYRLKSYAIIKISLKPIFLVKHRLRFLSPPYEIHKLTLTVTIRR